MSGSGLASGCSVLGAKWSMAEMIAEVFGPATAEKMQVLHGVADLELDGDQTSWSLAAARTCGLMELVGLELMVNGRSDHSLFQVRTLELIQLNRWHMQVSDSWW